MVWINILTRKNKT